MEHSVHRVCCGISREHGVESVKITTGKLNSEFYCSMLDDFYDHGAKFRPFGDQAGIHGSKFSLE